MTFRHRIQNSYPPEFDVDANAKKHVEYDYTLAIKIRGRPPKPWRWEIYAAGKSKPVRQSEFFETMSKAIRTGKTRGQITAIKRDRFAYGGEANIARAASTVEDTSDCGKVQGGS